MVDIIIAKEPAYSNDVRWCFEQYYAELGELFGYAPDAALPLAVDDLTPPRGLVLVAREGGAPVGCGAVKLLDGAIGEIKRMWVASGVRGRGLGGRLLDALETAAVGAGMTTARLDSNERLDAAIALYRRRGYRDVPAFNDEPFATHWLEKNLAAGYDGGAGEATDHVGQHEEEEQL